MKADNETCGHASVVHEVCDQTLGVKCIACDELLAYCWQERHIPESLWNRACMDDDSVVPCYENRDSHCAVCGSEVTK